MHYCAHIILAKLFTSSVCEEYHFVFYISVLGSDFGARVRPKMAMMTSSPHLDMGGKEGSSCCDNSKCSRRAVLMFLKKYQKQPYQSREPANTRYNACSDRELQNDVAILLNCF